MEYLILSLLIHVILSMNVASNIMPLRSNLRAPVVAELDFTNLNKELKDYINMDIKDQINQTWDAKIKNSLSDLKSEILEKFDGRFTGLQQQIKAQSNSLEESMRNENKELNRNLTIEMKQLEQRISVQLLQQLVLLDCSDLVGKTNKSGVYLIHPGESVEFKTYCDMETDGGGWTVFQRRINGQTDFNRGWYDYKNGFGDPQAEYWMGNSKLALMTSKRQYELRINLEDFNGATAYAKYSDFSVGHESDKYRLTVNGYSGTAGDSLTYQNYRSFITKDNYNDRIVGDCAINSKGAWWYGDCYYSNLNGLYRGTIGYDNNGINWYHWTQQHQSLKSTSMMIRRKKIE